MAIVFRCVPQSLHIAVKSGSLLSVLNLFCNGWRYRAIAGLAVVSLLVIFVTGIYRPHVWERNDVSFERFQQENSPDDNVVARQRRVSLNYPQTRNAKLSMLSSDYSDPGVIDNPFNGETDSAITTSSPDDWTVISVSYAVVIDCGSSGSRVFVYWWPKHSGNPTELLRITQLQNKLGKSVVMKIEPGIAMYAVKPYLISSYLRPLLDYAAEQIPPEKHSETPLYVLCTAGMRMLPKRLQNTILNQIVESMPKLCNFNFLASHAEVITGVTEGLYSWLGLNYVLGNLQREKRHSDDKSNNSSSMNGKENNDDKRKTVGIIDMGGASLQVAFEIKSDSVPPDVSKQILDVNLGCDSHTSDHEYKVIVETFLHKGGNMVRKKYEKDLISRLENGPSIPSSTQAFRVEHDPCMSFGHVQELYQKKLGNSNLTQTVFLNGTGRFEECKQKLSSYLNKDDCDNSTSCILDGKYLPNIDYFGDHFYGSSEFYYCMEDILHIGGPYLKANYETEASIYCSTPWKKSWQKYLDGYFTNVDENRMKLQCFKSAWISVVLHDGLNFPSTYKHLTTVKYVNNSEIQWTLGAVLYKTRFLPLREIQRQSLQVKNRNKDEGLLDKLFYPFAVMSHYPSFLFICIAIVTFSLFISVIKFCLLHNRKRAATLRRVGSSVAYFMQEDV